MLWSGEARVHQAGEVVPAGTYQRVDGAVPRRVVLARPGSLPPSFDGRVALYREVPAQRQPVAPGR
jgi:hypothetical protein